MLHSFDIMVDYPVVETEEMQEIGEQLVTPSNPPCQRLARIGQDESAILFVFEQPIGIEPLHHVGDTGLRNFQAGCDVDDAGVALGLNQLEDSLQVILNRGGIAG